MSATLAICYDDVNSILPLPPSLGFSSNVAVGIEEIRLSNMLLLKGDDTLEQLAEKVGIDSSYLSQLNTRHRNMGARVARKFERRFKKPTGWMDQAHGKNSNASQGPDVQARVPLISWVNAGKFHEARDVYRVGDAEDWYPMPRKAGPNTYCLRVQGDSMTAAYGKSYPDGSLIFVDPDQLSPANGQRIIAKLNGSDEVTFKVFVQEAGRTFLKPLNPQHPPIFEKFRILGTVIGKWEDD